MGRDRSCKPEFSQAKGKGKRQEVASAEVERQSQPAACCSEVDLLLSSCSVPGRASNIAGEADAGDGFWPEVSSVYLERDA